MKTNIYKQLTKSVWLLCFFLGVMALNAQPPGTKCDSAAFNRTRNFDRHDTTQVVAWTDTTVGQYYAPCAPGTIRKKNVAFVHGLGGTNGSWVKQVDFTDTDYDTRTFAVTYAGYESSFLSVARELQVELHNKLNSGANSSFPNRCKNEDYVITHSQGGIAARFLDYQWDVSTSGTYGTRNFYGVVTFATPNAGAHVALSLNQHASFIQQTISSVILDPLADVTYDLTSKFGVIIGPKLLNGLNNLDTFIVKNLVPIGLASRHTNTLTEMTPGSPTMNALTNHNSKLHRVAFYATEDAPECWRVIDNFLNKEAADYYLWGAQPDNEFMDKAEEVRLAHLAEIINLENSNKSLRKQLKIPLWGLIKALAGTPKKIFTNQAAIDKRQTSVSFLNNANTQWRYIIGAYHKDSFTVSTRTSVTLKWQEKYGFLGKWYNQSRTFSTHKEALDYFIAVQVHDTRNVSYTNNVINTTTRSFFPSDGVVLEKSQKAFPGVKISDTDFMPHNNHMQVRNSSETKRVLEDLYDGKGYDRFFMLR